MRIKGEIIMKKMNDLSIKKNEYGFTYIEVIIAIALLSICIIPIFSMVFSSSRNAIYGKKYYEATILAQNLSEEIKTEIQERLANYDPIYDSDPANPDKGPLGKKGDVNEIVDFLKNVTPGEFDNNFKTDKYLYEIYIKETNGLDDKYIIADSDFYAFNYGIPDLPVVGGDYPTPTTHIDFELESSDYATYFSPTYMPSSMVGVDYSEYKKKFIDFGFDKKNSRWIQDGDGLDSSIYASIKFKDDTLNNKYRYNIKIEPTMNGYTLTTGDTIVLNLDARYAEDLLSSKKLVVRIDNESPAKAVLNVYRLTTSMDEKIEVMPIQNCTAPDLEYEGDIYTERKTKIFERENFLIKINIRDKNDMRILKEMVDIYSYDYRLATY